jgi:hypothetical protein
VGLRPDPVGQLLLEPDEEGRDPLDGLRGRHGTAGPSNWLRH